MSKGARILKQREEVNRMRSEWKVTSNIIGDSMRYAVYRIRDINEVDHSGNREFAGDYIEDKQTAMLIAEELNKKEKAR